MDLLHLFCQVESCHPAEETENSLEVCRGTEEETVQCLEAYQMETGCDLGETALFPEVFQGLVVALVAHWVRRQQALQRD